MSSALVLGRRLSGGSIAGTDPKRPVRPWKSGRSTPEFTSLRSFLRRSGGIVRVRVRAIVAGEIKAQRVEKVGRAVALGLLEVDLHARDEGDI